MEQKSDVIHRYLRPKKKFPHVWCSGCGLGVILGSLIRSIDALEIPKDNITVCSGIGCSSRLPVYVDFNTLHTTHGRAIAFATGVKVANDRLKVIVVTGDGDCLAIGGNHFIHACRRNIDITVILANNWIYGMTGGQYSPTTPTTKFGSTAPYGNLEQPFDPAKLAIASGAAYVARTTVYHVDQMDKMIKGALAKKGFSVVEVISNCHTYFGRLNRAGDAVQMLDWMKKHAMPIQAARKLPPEKMEGKFVTGLLHDEEKDEYCEKYARLVDELMNKSGAR
ncbi:MAG: 2-oxoacid:ferredoxin oxidoreductase subunit beta [candidate division Zixibacteria bacterium]|nr:2-oxoacid:ferredoxin oxidoreductase subunit beta [candidate division Zixibacteria bacterium]MBU1469415.1 2-oxoacid:ferredoxin oxidoreductase subunit beta [candidate division Zixibacteria bacterium]MBU2624169.1 2-oxoacid:ferredoxin oxidoreductase subunit beta [candidate division Zixibacteria bacterium]